jgi:hypothetical protein
LSVSLLKGLSRDPSHSEMRLLTSEILLARGIDLGRVKVFDSGIVMAPAPFFMLVKLATHNTIFF